MNYQEIKFFVKDGVIASNEKFITADSINSLKAVFSFDEHWSNLTKTAIFRKGENTFHTVLEDDACIIPFEVITKGVLHISVFGIAIDQRLTTTECVIEIKKSGYTVCTPAEPFLDPYNYYLFEANKILENCSNDHMWAKFYAEKAEKMASEVSHITKSILGSIDSFQQAADTVLASNNIAKEKAFRIIKPLNLSEYLKNNNINIIFENVVFKAITKAEYEEKYNKGIKEKGTIYFVYEG